MEASAVEGFQSALKSVNIPMGDIIPTTQPPPPMQQQQPGPSTITVGNDTFVFEEVDESLTNQQISDTTASAESPFSTQIWPPVETKLSVASSTPNSSSMQESNDQPKGRNSASKPSAVFKPLEVKPRIPRLLIKLNKRTLSDNQPKASQADPKMDVQLTGTIKTETVPQKENKISAKRRQSEYHRKSVNFNPPKRGSEQCPVCLKYFVKSYVKKHAKDIHNLNMIM